MEHTYIAVIDGKEVVVTQRGRIDPSIGARYRRGDDV
jgi:hypothetical protein